MIRPIGTSTLSFLAALLAAGPAPATRAAQDVTLLKDLTSVILLLGLPCGEVVSAKKLSDNDHVAVCSNGTRYRVFVNAEGRVVAEKQ